MSLKSAFARLEVQKKTTVTLQNILDHGHSKEHEKAFQKLQDFVSKPQLALDQITNIEGQVSGFNSQVPRVDRFVAVATSVINYETYISYRERRQAVVSSLQSGGWGQRLCGGVQADLGLLYWECRVLSA